MLTDTSRWSHARDNEVVPITLASDTARKTGASTNATPCYRATARPTAASPRARAQRA